MAMVMTKVNVALPDEFFDALEALDRRKFGEIKCVDQMDDDAHNQIYLFFEWASVESAKAFWTSPEGMAHIATWRSMTAPQFVFLRDARKDDA